MKKLLVIAMLFATCAIFAQNNSVSVGAGVLEQSRVLGVALGLQAEFNHEFTRNVGVMVGYTYGVLQTGNAKLITMDGSVLKQAPYGSTFHQGSLLVNGKFYTNDGKVAIRTGLGAALQQGGEFYPTGQLDIIAFANSNIYPYLSWQPVFRDSFNSGKGWSHTVTLNLAIKL